jgi:hypothetical protein
MRHCRDGLFEPVLLGTYTFAAPVKVMALLFQRRRIPRVPLIIANTCQRWFQPHSSSCAKKPDFIRPAYMLTNVKARCLLRRLTHLLVLGKPSLTFFPLSLSLSFFFHSLSSLSRALSLSPAFSPPDFIMLPAPFLSSGVRLFVLLPPRHYSPARLTWNPTESVCGSLTLSKMLQRFRLDSSSACMPTRIW